MATATVDDLSLAYDVVGVARPGGNGRSWVITPGGRSSKDTPGVRELAATLSADGNRVLVWDRRNTGESEVCFTETSESALLAPQRSGWARPRLGS